MGTAISLMSGSDLNAKKVLAHSMQLTSEQPFPSEEECEKSSRNKRYKFNAQWARLFLSLTFRLSMAS